ncbi:hypothetical protein LK09_08615 [Microbacterium mangrovi]|uniref:Protein-glutamine gamma-glutamyltransferase-like C-terminal domain-containing protein n=1 Tax=Microbacterium mangrovi TaxID=1348253 RepID=A0A0B2A5Y1_9MICO|nr:DUF4129 domain-containing protein [Microbacterium mangrovi]KHK98904.1 hypothetical protein LK09_08615 [Microbacterium mangrovi]
MRPLSDSAPPLTPDGATAQSWAREELRDPAYAAAHPTAFDRFARSVQEFFLHLFDAGAPGDSGRWLAVIACVVLVVLLIVAVVLWGRPRARRRAAAGDEPSLFGDVEHRTAAQLRKAAAAAADRADWDTAVILRQRALARGLAERGLLDTPPGTTVHGFARSAAVLLPDLRDELDAAATAFDDVRYLRLPGTAERYARVAHVDDAAASRTVAAEATT